MSPTIDYYYFGLSPFAYFGHKAICDVAKANGATLNIKPVNLFGLWEVSGAVPPAKRLPIRQKYGSIDIPRVAEYRQVPVTLPPAHFPVDVTLSDSCAIAIADQGADPAEYVGAAMAGVWNDGANMSEEGEVASRLTKCGFDADAIMNAAKSESVAEKRATYTQEAIDSGAVGVPAYVLNGEVFFGQDRIEYIDHALKTGRAPFGV